MTLTKSFLTTRISPRCLCPSSFSLGANPPARLKEKELSVLIGQRRCQLIPDLRFESVTTLRGQDYDSLPLTRRLSRLRHRDEQDLPVTAQRHHVMPTRFWFPVRDRERLRNGVKEALK